MFKFTTVLIAAMACCSAAGAQGYPNKPIDLVVPFAPGGTVNLTARLLATRMSQMLGQPVIVDNKPGAGGAIGAAYVAKARADGYTLLYATMGSQVIQPLLTKNLTFSPAKDFTPIALFATVPNVLAVSANTPAKNMAELLQYAKANPGKLNMGSAGQGSVNHMIGELFMLRTGVKFTHVPYKGAGPATTDLLGGQIQILFANLPGLQPYAKAGKIRLLGVASHQRNPAIPDVPTFEELGIKNAETESWSALMAPAGTSAEVIRKLQDTVRTVATDPAMVKQLIAEGAQPFYGTSDTFAKVIAEDNKRWTEVVKRANVQLD
ncbi:Tripartite-type tricarboxylate transporter, receptor component TctC [Cupriavidus sp. OV038]|jgi:tripartite-type tricarboxylate transporter receptor subunit TctC|uniref:Bug family tripartite tricarboxylate transporter substrate binding protein n=1 Tax=unclassified Cupriavidus TaxID=2640874 RepID=UPI0008E989B4|nr:MULTISPECIES: tripartite tricarboxylate transporter substrate binding protein [unclassified Cupriavidus]SFB90903.1 Tripartite-type tricarboxylate transporter, receptor component TctC [Cupriavidus sp. OV038]SFO99393.1 Tripartite-type tricarboxylate transporter, receptor component TctC [Cupriavidus sp. OV096]